MLTCTYMSTYKHIHINILAQIPYIYGHKYTYL
jgi:hypothetical protein